MPSFIPFQKQKNGWHIINQIFYWPLQSTSAGHGTVLLLLPFLCCIKRIVMALLAAYDILHHISNGI